MLYSNSRFPEIPYGKKLHDHVVERVDNVMCDHWDFDEFTNPAEKAPTFRYGDESARQAWRFWKILL